MPAGMLKYAEANRGWTRIVFVGVNKFGQCEVTVKGGRWIDSDGEPARYLGIAKIGTVWTWNRTWDTKQNT